ncbi:hypothetical protein [Oceanibaculum indicum]|uniref:Lipoprotein n=1 Tax=Oceanibaculum indicum P24 TaxID=1207063 RepID=K2KIY8_9PROT|nr:hypothetical protein [Oceanibaculum indicum]EKE77215.1 hypothetical protein P24_05522 [Oceanibaculum indicum P24]
MQRRFRFSNTVHIFVITLLVGLAGCASTGPTDNPLRRSLTWFSYLGGDDLRTTCQPGSPERYRFVYNARAEEQIRTYDIIVGPSGTGRLESHVLTNADLDRLSVVDPLRPWRGEESEVTVGAAEINALRSALAASGFDQPAPRGTFLRSDDFYWIVSACRDGAFRFNAYRRDMPSFEAIRFDAPLFAMDPLTRQVAVNPPRELNLAPFLSAQQKSRLAPGVHGSPPWQVQVGENGLKTGLFD